MGEFTLTKQGNKGYTTVVQQPLLLINFWDCVCFSNLEKGENPQVFTSATKRPLFVKQNSSKKQNGSSTFQWHRS